MVRDFQLIAEKADFFRLGFKVLIPLVQKNEIEHRNAPLDVLDFVFPEVANVLSVDLAVEAAGEQVIDRPALWKTFGPGVTQGAKFVPEDGSALAPVGVGEAEELACNEVA